MRAYDSSLPRYGTRAAGLLLLALLAACADGPMDSPPAPEPPAAVAAVEVAPDTVHLVVGDTRGLDAIPRAGNGRTLTGRSVAWRSGDEAVARVDASGNVTALREGTAVVTATSEGREGHARIVVTLPQPIPVAAVLITGGDVEIEPGQNVQLGVTLRAADGGTLTGREVTWSSSDESIAIVNAGGVVRGKGRGTVTITATSEGREGQATLRIPGWVALELHTVEGKGLPAVVRSTPFTDTRGGRMERLLKVSSARIWFSTTRLEYHQTFSLEIWDRVADESSFIYGTEVLVERTVVEDRGEATGYDLFTGEPVFVSSRFAGHTFTPRRDYRTGTRTIRQAIPNEGETSYELIFRR